MNEKIKEIHESLVNGQRRQMVKQIDEYGSCFWEDYRFWLPDFEWMQSKQFSYFADATISYFRIKNR